MKKLAIVGWKSLIPFYNEYILWKIADRNLIKDILIVALLMILSIFTFGITAIIALLYVIIIMFLLSEMISESFGHGIGYDSKIFHHTLL